METTTVKQTKKKVSKPVTDTVSRNPWYHLYKGVYKTKSEFKNRLTDLETIHKPNTDNKEVLRQYQEKVTALKQIVNGD